MQCRVFEPDFGFGWLPNSNLAGTSLSLSNLTLGAAEMSRVCFDDKLVECRERKTVRKQPKGAVEMTAVMCFCLQSLPC